MLGCRAFPTARRYNVSNVLLCRQTAPVLAIRTSRYANLPHRNIVKSFRTSVSQLAAPIDARHDNTNNSIPVNSALRERLANVSGTLKSIEDLANWQAMQDEVSLLQKELEDNETWNNTENAMKIQTRLGHLQKQLATYRELSSSYTDISELVSLMVTSLDLSMENELTAEVDALAKRTNEYLVSLWLSRPTDMNSAYVDIHAGSGGTEACDWASMLARMYIRWAQSRNFSVQLVQESLGDVAGIKSTTLLIEGPYAYGYAQYETGVHRLVRISPFDNAGARHTSFASVRVSVHFDDNCQDVGIDLKPNDLKITTMRSQGAGGQHVNKTESAVRIVHIPSGITILCQQERSQHRNKLLALSLLKSKLYEMDMQKRAQSKVEAHNTLPENAWGSQVRSYVLQPYQLVKDTRTGHEVSSGTLRVLDGDLDDFMEACLRKFRAKQS
ncbi:hypothetical protein QCA50_020135 [Cerrena zonata]|uniref:Prokaryotic-type class I peptide chain release factors domain-containing protein n=1 Tax=Cerrena zonata TaxID=2478898 RepID=A0AAW0FDS3_9APHY